MKITILGAGAWGSAMAIHLNRCGQRVTLVPRRIEHSLEISSSRANSYLPGIEFPLDLQVASHLVPALFECEVLIFACPSKALRETARKAKEALGNVVCSGGNCPNSGLKIAISLCKGVEAKTFLRAEEVLKQELGNVPVGTISGPTNAAEVAAGKPVAVVFSCENSESEICKKIQSEFSNDAFRIYLSSDVPGVELGGSLKNIYAIAAGVCDGMQLGANARASLLTRALAEMSRIAVAFGGSAETVRGLSGMGDLIASATADWSRNRAFGLLIGSRGIDAALEKMASGTSIVEGFYATKNFHEFVKSKGISAPILELVYAVIFEKKSPQSAISELMNRNLKAE